MKVLILTGEYPPVVSGVGDYAAHVAESVASLGLSLFVLTSAGNGISDDVRGNVPVFRKVRGWDWRSFAGIKETIKRLDPDIFHLQYHTYVFQKSLFVNFLPALLKRDFPGKKMIITYHEFAAPMKRTALLPLFLAGDYHHVTNEHHFGYLRKILKIMGREDRAVNIPLASNILPVVHLIPRRKEIRNRFGLGEQDFLAVRFGILHDVCLRELRVLLGAIKILKANHKIKLLHVGKQEPKATDQLLKISRELGVEDALVLTGDLDQEEVSGCLFAADAGLSPYADGISEKRTGFLALLSHGLPVIANKGTFFPSMLKDKENLWCLPAGADDKAWAEAIERLILSSSMRSVLSEGAKTLAKRFDWNVIGREMAALYEKALS